MRFWKVDEADEDDILKVDEAVEDEVFQGG